MLTHDMPNKVESYYAAQVKGQPKIYTTPSFPVSTLGTKVFQVKCYKVLTELCLYIRIFSLGEVHRHGHKDLCKVVLQRVVGVLKIFK